MSSTNVHSVEEQENIYCVGAQTIPTEEDVEIPPKSANRGPSSLEVVHGNGMEIPVEESELHRDGTLVAKDGAKVAKFDKNAFTRIEAKHQKQGKTLKDKQGHELVDQDGNPLHLSDAAYDLSDFNTVKTGKTGDMDR